LRNQIGRRGLAQYDGDFRWSPAFTDFSPNAVMSQTRASQGEKDRDSWARLAGSELGGKHSVLRPGFIRRPTLPAAEPTRGRDNERKAPMLDPSVSNVLRGLGQLTRDAARGERQRQAGGTAKQHADSHQYADSPFAA
jgi:hypothetical protein